MKITLCGSISFAKEIMRIKEELSRKGHDVLVPQSIIDFSINNEKDAETLKSNREKYLNELKPFYTKNHFSQIEKSDAILVVNIAKNGIQNYIGGATFAETMIALYLGKKIFLLNPLPTDKRFSFIIDELEASRPTILNGNLEMIG